MHKSMMSYPDRYNARQQRMNDIQNLGMDHVMERDKVLRQRGWDPLLDAEEYERTRLRVKFEPSKSAPELSINGSKVENILKTKSVSEVIDKFIENYSEDDYPPMFKNLLVKTNKTSKCRNCQHYLKKNVNS